MKFVAARNLFNLLLCACYKIISKINVRLLQNANSVFKKSFLQRDVKSDFDLNHFGIKCHKEWRGKRIYHDDDEKGECFRVYKDPRKSYRDHSLFLTSRSRYDFLFDIKKNDYKAWAKGLKKAGYATDPKYPDKLISLIERYRLDRYDLKKRKAKKQMESMATTIDQKVHQVQKGDTLYSIAKKYKVDLHLIVQENKIENNAIFLGQNLIIPQAQ